MHIHNAYKRTKNLIISLLEKYMYDKKERKIVNIE